uniref:Uncharacterized protein LOC102806207 n=1 Tax=Saccoglossus kowalevskii TaxID=10224 RepID=A0ABM0MB53_SACKO
FLGTTPDSTMIYRLLTSLCQQICKVRGEDAQIPESTKELKDFFQRCLTLTKDDQKIVIFLDSLDQLNPHDGARQLTWLPRQLPPNVKLIVSTLPEDEHTCFPLLQSEFATISVVDENCVRYSIWSLNTGVPERSYTADNIPFDNSGRNLLHCLDSSKGCCRIGDGDEKTLSVVKFDNWSNYHKCGEGKTSQYLFCALVSEGREILAGSPFERDILLFGVENGELIECLSPNTNENCYQMTTNRHGTTAVLHFHSHGLQIWSIAERKVLFRITTTTKTSDIEYILSADGRYMVVNTPCSIHANDGERDIKMNSVIEIIKEAICYVIPSTEKVKGFIGENNKIVTSNNELWNVWSIEKGQLIQSWKMPTAMHNCVIVDAEKGSHVLLSSEDRVKKSVMLLDVDQGEVITSFTFDNRIDKCILSGSGRVVSAIIDGELVSLRLVGKNIP